MIRDLTPLPPLFNWPIELIVAIHDQVKKGDVLLDILYFSSTCQMFWKDWCKNRESTTLSVIAKNEEFFRNSFNFLYLEQFHVALCYDMSFKILSSILSNIKKRGFTPTHKKEITLDDLKIIGDILLDIGYVSYTDYANSYFIVSSRYKHCILRFDNNEPFEIRATKRHQLSHITSKAFDNVNSYVGLLYNARIVFQSPALVTIHSPFHNLDWESRIQFLPFES